MLVLNYFKIKAEKHNILLLTGRADKKNNLSESLFPVKRESADNNISALLIIHFSCFHFSYTKTVGSHMVVRTPRRSQDTSERSQNDWRKEKDERFTVSFE